MPDHPHGTNDRYLNGPCRCPQCREAHRADGARRRRLIAYGTWQGRVDATEAQLHIKQLTADGMTYAAIARAAGLPDKQPIQDIANGQRTTSPQRLAAILAVTYQPPIRVNHVPAVGTYRRLEGLAAVGWSYQAIDDAAGSDLKARNLMRKRPDTVRAETAKAVERAARHLITRTAPANRYTTLIANRARESGWVPIAVWDMIDEPDWLTAMGESVPEKYLKTTDDRLRVYVDRSGGPDACWPWIKSKNRYGYGFIRDSGKIRTAHRVAWEVSNGPLSSDFDLDHLCHTEDVRCPGGIECPHRACCNPAHLEPVDRKTNAQRGARSFQRTGRCRSGKHEVDNPSSWYIHSDGSRECDQCRRERSRARFDNPDETPKTDRPTRTYHGRVGAPDPELIERIHRLHRQGFTDQQIAQAVGGRTASSVQKIRARNPVQEKP